MGGVEGGGLPGVAATPAPAAPRSDYLWSYLEGGIDECVPSVLIPALGTTLQLVAERFDNDTLWLGMGGERALPHAACSARPHAAAPFHTRSPGALGL